MMGIESLKSGFYTEKFEIIDNVVRSYAQLKNSDQHNLEELAGIKHQAQTLLAQMMIESGIKGEDAAFISLDQEFFDDDGAFSETKLGAFQKMMIQYYALNDIQWTFAGTSQFVTAVSNPALHKEGIDYTDMVPIEIRRKHNQEEIRRITGKTPNAARVFIYSDGSVSNQYIPKKNKLHFDALVDDNPQLWENQYDPNLKINKNNWFAGFNKNNDWEYIPFNKETVNTAKHPSQKTFPAINNDPIDWGVAHLHASAINESLLLDPENLLMDGKTEHFYSINGDLYGSRSIDQASTLAEIKKSLKKGNIEKITGIVTKNTEKETQSYYKKALSPLIDKNTQFYNINDEATLHKIMEIKKQIKENQISNEIIEKYTALVKQGNTGDALYQLLLSGTDPHGETDENLQIFADPKDLDTFITSPDLKAVMDDETITALKKLKSPGEKTNELSNSVQNILKNYDTLFKYAYLEKKDLIQAAYQTVVQDDPQNLAGIKILKEKKLIDLINENNGPATRTDIPSFKRLFKKEDDYYDIYSEEGLQKWNDELQQNRTLSPENIQRINQKLSSLNIPPSKKQAFVRSLQNTFDEFKTIQENTGLRPDELTELIYQTVVEEKEDSKAANKKVVFEKNLPDLIRESKRYNPYKVKRIKENRFREKSNFTLESLNLIKNPDIDLLALTSLSDFNWSGVEEKNETIRLLKNTSVPFGSGKDFTYGITRIINKHKNKKDGKLLLEDFKKFIHALHHDETDLPTDLRSITDAVKKKNSIIHQQSPLNLFKETVQQQFIHDNHLNPKAFSELLNRYEDQYATDYNRILEEMPVVYNYSPDQSSTKSALPGEKNNFQSIGWKIELKNKQKTIYDLLENDRTAQPENQTAGTASDHPMKKNKGSVLKKILQQSEKPDSINTDINQDKEQLNKVDAKNFSMQDDAFTDPDFMNALYQKQKKPDLETILSQVVPQTETPNYIFANPYTGLLKKRQELLAKTQNNNQNRQNGIVLNPSNQTETDPKMQRINQNYLSDKQSLARSQSHSLKTTSDQASPDKGKSNQKIDQTAEEFINTIKKEIDYSNF